MADLYHPGPFRERLARIIDYKNRLLGAMLSDFVPFDAEAVAEEYLRYAERLRPFVATRRPGYTWHSSRTVASSSKVQGSLLDIDHGS